MAHQGWLRENACRSYPLVTQPTGLPYSAIVDFGALMGYNSGYKEGVHSVWLSRIWREADTFFFEISSDAPGCEGHPLVFRRELGQVNVTEHTEVLP